MNEKTDYKVRAVYCDHKADDETVYNALRRATQPLERSWAKLKAAKRIAIKFNQDWVLSHVVYFEGQRRQLVSDSVARAVLRLLREETSAELVCVDASFYVMYQENAKTVADTTTLAAILQEFDVPYIDGTQPPYVVVGVPGGGQMFEQYGVMRDVIEADAVVSVAKMKNHAYMGVTACLKNLFGLMPTAMPGRPRHYYHHLVRMPYMLTDIGRIFKPALNIVDALVGQASSEWGREPDIGRIVNALIAGDHVIATDACVAHLMGHNPQADWLTEPFHRDRNALRVAAESGFGTVNLDEIDFISEVTPQPEGTFFAQKGDDLRTIVTWRRTMCEQALCYRDHMRDFTDRYAGEFILLQDGEVKWHNRDGMLRVSRRQLSGAHPDHAMFFKYVDPEEREQEHYEVYEKALQHVRNLESPIPNP
ncbi:MAG TPA: DUF362 domain-containing protein [Anaerolineae bacterium]|nr:DUF362 domain-containing protein [Anaerolineae bacterium]HQK14472.1 DUF362 domain-containing protein [Anaerolineae bacterium]